MKAYILIHSIEEDKQEGIYELLKNDNTAYPLERNTWIIESKLSVEQLYTKYDKPKYLKENNSLFICELKGNAKCKKLNSTIYKFLRDKKFHFP
jgi:hypothetical protein